METIETDWDILSYMNTFWNGKNQFPGPQPISIERKHIDFLKNNSYYVCQKSDGIRYALVCCVFDDKHVCCLIDRNLKVHLMQLRCSKEFYKGSLFDAEYVDGKFYIFDCVVMCGIDVHTEPFSKRIQNADTFVKGVRSANFIVKECIPLKQFSGEFKDKNHMSDGYIFIPEAMPVKSGTHYTYFKLKKGSSNTVDFLLKDNNLYLQRKGEAYKTKNKLSENIPDNNVIVECEYDPNKKWKVVKVRTDKDTPNSEYTFKKTLINIKENISIDEILSMVRNE